MQLAQGFVPCLYKYVQPYVHAPEGLPCVRKSLTELRGVSPQLGWGPPTDQLPPILVYGWASSQSAGVRRGRVVNRTSYYRTLSETRVRVS